MRTLLKRPLWTALLLILGFHPGTTLAQQVGPSLEEALAIASPVDRIEIVVSFDSEGPLTTQQVGQLQALGVSGIWFQSLPIAGVVATPAQIGQIRALPGVRSIWKNDELILENDTQTAATGVDRLRADEALRSPSGLPYSGRGIGVLVNDSGIDATHPDLQDNVVENVAGQTNLASLNALLPVTYLKGIPNTDNGGGHGTHVAGILGGTGAASGGKFEGVAPGADIIGYGSGAVVLVLDALGGFDFALTHQAEYNIRVVSNSFGESNDNGTDFQPDHPTNIATKMLADRGIIVVFSAGNSGPVGGTITGNYKKAPWVISVAASDSEGRLGSFSSRGRVGQGGSFVGQDGVTYTWEDRPTLTAPGTGVVSANASTGTLHYGLHPEFIPYYSVATGTSMACPHVSGIIAMMLEADPTLQWHEVKEILQASATNMPAHQPWEAGAGFVNAHAAVRETVLRRDGERVPGATVNLLRDFNSEASLEPTQPWLSFDVPFSPAGPTEGQPFQVLAETELVTATATVGENTAALVLTDPHGAEYVSAVSVPGYQATVTVTAPAQEGTWTVSVRGLNAWVGLRLDAFGLTNGLGVPGRIQGQIAFVATRYSGLDDVAGREDEALLTYAVARRLVDGDKARRFRPEDRLRRGELAEYLVMGAGIRRSARDGFLSDVSRELSPFAHAVASGGAALMDIEGTQAPVVLLEAGSFRPSHRVTREAVAYSLIQSLGLQEEARSHGTSAVYSEDRELADWQSVDPALRGYVQLALDLGLMLPEESADGPVFRPGAEVSRAAFAKHMVTYADGFRAAPLPDLGFSAKGNTGRLGSAPPPEMPGPAVLEQNFPNPFNGSTVIGFEVSKAGPVRLTVYDSLGREVARLVEGTRDAGRHVVRLNADGLASGTYLYRLDTASGAAVRTLALIR